MQKPWMISGAVVAMLAVTPVGAASALTRAQWVKAANAICAKATIEANAEIAKIANVNSPNPAYFKKLAPIAVTVLSKEVDEFAKLDPPTADQTDIKQMLGFLRGYIKKIKKDPQVLANGKKETVGANKIASKLGISGCGS